MTDRFDDSMNDFAPNRLPHANVTAHDTLQYRQVAMALVLGGGIIALRAVEAGTERTVAMTRHVAGKIGDFVCDVRMACIPEDAE